MLIPAGSREQVNRYIEQTFTNVPEVVHEFAIKAKQMGTPPHHVSPQLGKLLAILARSIKPKVILEIGTMWGYSAWWLAQGLATGGKVITYEKHLEHYRLAQEFIELMNLNNVEARYGDALLEFEQLEDNSVDMIFLDADKAEYPGYFKCSSRLLRSGGLFIADNIIYSSNWHTTTVADETDNTRIKAAQDFNLLFANNPEYMAVPVAIDSGIMVAIKL